jgi:hypothetical protein
MREVEMEGTRRHEFDVIEGRLWLKSRIDRRKREGRRAVRFDEKGRNGK